MVCIWFNPKLIPKHEPEPKVWHKTRATLFLNNTNEVTKYLGIQLDQRLNFRCHYELLAARVRKRMRYINSLFRHRDRTARITLFQSLILPLFDYCSPVSYPKFIMSIDASKSCLRHFLKTVVSSIDLSYVELLKEQGWDCLLLCQIKRSLELVYKLVFGVVPLGEKLFARFVPEISANAIAGNTRQAMRLAEHPHGLPTTGSVLSSYAFPASEESFAHWMCKLWNELPLLPDAYENLVKFKIGLSNINWRSLDWTKNFLEDKHSSFF